jgi:hypothetical protein
MRLLAYLLLALPLAAEPVGFFAMDTACLLYTSDAADDIL